MYDTGLGVEHVNRFLSGLSIPVPNPSALKKREREVIPHIQTVAEESCQ